MQKDEVLRCYLSDNARYADLMNGMIFEGRNVVQPEDLQPLDSRVEGKANTRYRDLIRRSCFGVNFAVVGVENQEEVHYLMPLRCAEYDVYEYRRQAREIERRMELDRKQKLKCRAAMEKEEHGGVARFDQEESDATDGYGKEENETGARFGNGESETAVLFSKEDYRSVGQTDTEESARDIKGENFRGLTSGEYLFKFHKSDHLHPCVTLVLFYGEDWDGSRDLYGLMDFTDIPQEFRSLVNNYRMNLLEVRKLSCTDMFHTDLKQVLDFIRYSKDKKKLRELVEQEEAYRHMNKEAFDVAMTFTHSRELKVYRDKVESKEDLDMCQAITEMLADEREQGRSEGKSEGIELGRNEGRLEGMLHTLYKLVEQGLLTLRDAAVQAQMPESEFLAGMQSMKR